MRADGVVKGDPLSNDLSGHKTIAHLVQVNRLVFERTPEPLDEDVIKIAAPAIHGDADACCLQNTGKGKAGELAALTSPLRSDQWRSRAPY